MNKEILNQIPADEQPIASKLQAVADDMQLSPTFEWELETKLMEKHKAKTRPLSSWYAKIAPTLGWAFTAIFVILLVNWAIRSLVPGLSAASNTQQPEITPTVVPSNTPQPTPIFTPVPGQIAFVSDESGHDQIYLMNSDGSEIHRLTTDDNNNSDPAWSPDGKKLAFTRLRGPQGEVDGHKSITVEGAEIVVMDADGSNPVSLTHNLSEQGFAAFKPAWSPDGKHIAFQAVKVKVGAGGVINDWNIYMVDTSGSGEIRQITAWEPENGMGCGAAEWLPDSKRLVAQCHSSTSQGGAVLFNTEDGSSLPIFEHQDALFYGASQAGKLAVSEGNFITTFTGIDLSEKISFEKPWARISALAWSPTAADKLAVRAMDGVFVINEDGSQLIKIASFGNYQDPDTSLSWSPDGSQIVFATMQDYQKNILNGNQEIMIAALDHTSMIRLTFTDANESQPAWRPSVAEESSTSKTSFEDNVRAGNICAGPLAAAHNNSVSLTNQDKTGFALIDDRKGMDEFRDFAWSPDGAHLAVLGVLNRGKGNVYITDAAGTPLQPVLSESEDEFHGGSYWLTDVAWSPDGKQLLTSAGDMYDNAYLMNMDGTDLAEIKPGMELLYTLEIVPANESIAFYGSDSSSAGWVEMKLNDLQTTTTGTTSDLAVSFARSPDGTRLAYIEMDWDLRETRLLVKDVATGSTSVLGTLPFPEDNGSSYGPGAGNLSWSPDGKMLTFEFGTIQANRGVYLAHADRAGLIKVADSAHAPAMSADGNCLAYISKQQVFLIDLNSISSNSLNTTPILLADLPDGKSSADFRYDELQWPPAEMPTAESSFEADVRAGNICPGPLALAYNNLSVALTNQDKSGYILLDEQKTIGELRDFAWSPDGTKLAIAGVAMGSGDIYLTDSTGASLQPILSDSKSRSLYLSMVAWSTDGKQLITQAIPDLDKLYMTNIDGDPLVKIQSSKYVLSKPQFTPNNRSIIYYGADSDSSGLFETMLDGSQTRLISPLVESAGSRAFALSPDGSRLAYMEIDRNKDQDMQEARLILEKLSTGEKSVLGKFPIPKGTGLRLPEASHMSWSADGKIVTFEIRIVGGDRAVYLAYADATGLVKLAEAGHAPTISADGNCLAYIDNKQLFVLDLSRVSLNSSPPAPLRLAGLPDRASYIEQLQWRP